MFLLLPVPASWDATWRWPADPPRRVQASSGKECNVGCRSRAPAGGSYSFRFLAVFFVARLLRALCDLADAGSACWESRMSDPKSLTLLAVDDNPENLELIRASLEELNVEILTAGDPEVGFEIFMKARPRIVLLDLVMPKINGMELLERIIAIDPGTDVILITSHYSPESAVEAIQKGASDYWTKPLDVEKLRGRISGFIGEAEKRQKTLRLDRELLDACQFEGMVGRSPVMLEVFARIRRVAPHFRTVLVTGATGTGKELVAHALHRLSPASRGQFAVCNCSALVENLVESELFGYVRGAFTGATQDKAGLFRACQRRDHFSRRDRRTLDAGTSQVAARSAESRSTESRLARSPQH